MAQVETGIRSVLSIPIVYNFLQNTLGASNVRKELAEKYLNFERVERVLDIGCGTAELLQWIPENVEYVGFDASKVYIKAAQDRYNDRNARFFTKCISEVDLHDTEPFDLITAVGVIHHLCNIEVEKLFKVAAHALKDKGIFVSIDPCYVSDQSFISKAFIDRDRGQNVRTSKQYSQLAERVFKRVTSHHRNDLLRIPYDYSILVCSI
jgi:cyclopropane fatty-acyl-phospholipid synthase-like methyltransferase